MTENLYSYTADRCCGTGRQYCPFIVPKAVYTVKKCSWRWGNLSPETCRADLKKLIKKRLLHLVGCLFCFTNDALSHKHQVLSSYCSSWSIMGSEALQSCAILAFSVLSFLIQTVWSLSISTEWYNGTYWSDRHLWQKLWSKIKVKRTLIQALRLCTGHTAQRGSSGIALPFLDLGTRSGWGVSVTTRPLFTPGKDLVHIVQDVERAPGPVWRSAENLAPTGIRSSDHLACSQSLYRLSFPAHKNYEVPINKILFRDTHSASGFWLLSFTRSPHWHLRAIRATPLVP